jgi:NAD+ kinase
MGWQRIGIVLKGKEVGRAALVGRLIEVARARGAEVVVDSHAAVSVPGLDADEVHPQQEVIDAAELLVVLGGDGSVLAAARAVGDRDVPILGINLGHLGFLTEVRQEDAVAALDRVLAGAAQVVERQRIAVRVLRAGREISSGVALNDAVITKGSALARMIELDVRVDGEHIAMFRSDGLIVATPTGSTAYNLSAGGPVVEPSVEALVVNPICPHILSLRPLVVRADCAIEVILRVEQATLTRDGQVGTSLEPGDRVCIARAAHPARFVELAPHDHFETLRTKLGWGSH